jgi:hypothetical protein
VPRNRKLRHAARRDGASIVPSRVRLTSATTWADQFGSAGVIVRATTFDVTGTDSKPNVPGRVVSRRRWDVTESW